MHRVGDSDVIFDASTVQGDRQTMEDRWNVSLHEDGRAAVFAIFDGHGGAQVSSYLMENLSQKILRDRELKADPVGVLKRSFGACDDEIVTKHEESNPKRYPGPGSTAVVVLVMPPKAFVAHVGDSRAIFVNSEGQIIFQTKDQRPDCPLEHSRILKLGGTVRTVRGVVRASGILAVSRAFGNGGIKYCIKADPDVKEINLSDISSFVLCSDGLTDVVSSTKIAELLSGTRRSLSIRSTERTDTCDGHQGKKNTRSSKRTQAGELKSTEVSQDLNMNLACSNVRRIANALTGLAKQRQSTDNISVVVLNVHSNREAESDGVDTHGTDGVDTHRTSTEYD